MVEKILVRAFYPVALFLSLPFLALEKVDHFFKTAFKIK